MLNNQIQSTSLALRSLVALVGVLSIIAGPGVNAEVKETKMAQKQNPAATNRPMRTAHKLVLTVGQDRGDLRGNDDKIIQAGIEYLNRLGGGTLQLLPGTYNLRNFIYLRPNITLRGSGDNTILRKSACVSTPLVRESDWFEYGVQVKDPSGFTVGGGIMLKGQRPGCDSDDVILRATVTDIVGDVIFLDQQTKENFWMRTKATASTAFSMLYAQHVDDVRIENLVLEGNAGQNPRINGNYAGAVFMQNCNRWTFKNVTAQNYNGDGYSFQICDDIQFYNCKAIDNAGMGFHAGSGAQRPIFRNCLAKGNWQGIYFCWGACDGIVEDCTSIDNQQYGINIGHRDTDNVIRNTTIERNGEVGIIFRLESDFRGGNRNLVENCIIRDNGKGDKTPGIGIDIQGKTTDITIGKNRIENTTGNIQQIGIRISQKAENITLEDNAFANCPVKVQDNRKN